MMTFFAVKGTIDNIARGNHRIRELPVQVLVVFNDQDTQV
jgi:hypothetical protein